VNDDDRQLLAEAMSAMHGLSCEMREFRSETQLFRGEMREFKEHALVRINALENDQVECQKNPTVCATARLVGSHLAGHTGGKSFAVSVWAVCVSTVMCAGTLIMAFMKRS